MLLTADGCRPTTDPQLVFAVFSFLPHNFGPPQDSGVTHGRVLVQSSISCSPSEDGGNIHFLCSSSGHAGTWLNLHDLCTYQCHVLELWDCGGNCVLAARTLSRASLCGFVVLAPSLRAEGNPSLMHGPSNTFDFEQYALCTQKPLSTAP